jgi:hypothetical protein
MEMAPVPPRCTIEANLVADIEVVFANLRALLTFFAITRPTWDKIKSGYGVKHSTADEIVRKFFSMLMDIDGGTPHGADIFPHFAKTVLAKYRKIKDDLSFSEFLIEVDSSAPAAKLVVKN